ncbi:MAG: helix-hairpin-helix domain-containing protein [Myxococcales bacterium]|nr:helix-hairpin-helix domain-containing protein [Myxococcales bacterium]MCB9708613.1 helix-hairpin-helix domain-containing protein [Myxococcales bacterium]
MSLRSNLLALAVIWAAFALSEHEQSGAHGWEKVPQSEPNARLPCKDDGSGACAWLQGKPLDLNQAGLEQLRLLPHVGPALAQRILAYRKEHGAFHSADELRHIKGIGKKTIDKLRRLVTVASSTHHMSNNHSRRKVTVR